jgi:hypothetical protein
MSETIPFNPNKHATTTHAYKKTHVAPKSVALAKIVFRPDDDEFRRVYGGSIRRKEECPLVNSLKAVPSKPLIGGREPEQQLSVPCDLLFHLGLPNDPTAWPICAARAAKAGLKPDEIPASAITNQTNNAAIRCPFASLTGVIGKNAAQITVMISARNPHDPDTLIAV